MAKMIFVVEDDESIGELICCTLNTGGFDAKLFENGEAFFNELKSEKPELVLLDIMLSGMDGFEILKKLQSDPPTADIPVIFLTARTSEVDKVTGLEHGADDYIAKPFGVLELLARIKAVLRRRDKAEKAESSDTDVIKVFDLEIDHKSKEVRKNGIPVKLTYKEYELLNYLFENRGIVISRNSLLENIWGFDFTGGTRTVDMHVKSLRQKLMDNIGHPTYIATVRGYGYKFIK